MMRENKIKVIINKPVEVVFEFTTNPKNTHRWIPSIQEEITDAYPPKVGTQYKNRGKSLVWDYYIVVEFDKNKIFTLSDADGNYNVKYTYKRINERQTEMEYFEWMKKGELTNPFRKEILQNLKLVLEST